MTNLEKYKKDLESLIARGEDLYVGIQLECYPDQFKAAVKKKMKERVEAMGRGAPVRLFRVSLRPIKRGTQKPGR